jgi:hypothetical protein
LLSLKYPTKGNTTWPWSLKGLSGYSAVMIGNLVLSKKNHFLKEICFILFFFRGRDTVGCIATRYCLDGPGNESRWEAIFSAPVQTGSGNHPASYTMGIVSFSRVKRLGCGVDHTLPSSAEIKERVETYVYSPCTSSWPVLGRKIPLF